MNDHPASNPSTGSGQAHPQPAPPQQSVRVALPSAAPYMTYAIIGLTVVFYLLQFTSVLIFGYPSSFSNIDWLELYGARINEFIQAGQFWRFLTPALLHSRNSITHIFFNMYALFSLGTSLERFFGQKRFLALYVLGAFAGNVTSFLFANSLYSVGASTAIFGLIGAEGVFLYQNRKLLGGQFRSAMGNVIFIVVINLFVIGSLPFIDNWGHIGGLLGGLMFTWFASPLWEIEGIQPMLRLADKRSSRDVVTGTVLVLLVFGALAVWGMVR